MENKGIILDNYPQLKQSVRYIRAVPGDAQKTSFEEGTGTIGAISLDPNGRLNIFLVPETEGANGFNVNVNCLNPSEDFKAKFKTLTEEVSSLAGEGNEAAGRIIADYNQRVDDAFNGLLSPVLFSGK